MHSSIYFFKDEIRFRFLKRNQITQWIKKVILIEGHKCGTINIVFCSDQFLLRLNKRFLKHDYFTDIITFDASVNDIVSGDIFISVDRVRENAKDLRLTFSSELHRVIIHGILHLIGYKDKTKTQKNDMRLREDACLSLLPSFT